MKTTKNTPDTSPYWVDPHLPRIVPYLCQSGAGHDSNKASGEDFSSVLITMWPPPLDAKVDDDARASTTLREAYGGFMSEVSKCFDPDDLEAESEKKLPHVYTYTPECLHITVATLHRFDVPTSPKEREDMQNIYTTLFQRAAKRSNWPPKGSKMKFTVDSTRIGERREYCCGRKRLAICKRYEIAWHTNMPHVMTILSRRLERTVPRASKYPTLCTAPSCDLQIFPKPIGLRCRTSFSKYKKSWMQFLVIWWSRRMSCDWPAKGGRTCTFHAMKSMYLAPYNYNNTSTSS